jgi:FkbM family methyltransferase
MGFIRPFIEQARDAAGLSLLFPARHLWKVLGIPTFRIDVRGGGPIEMRTGSTDAAVVRQIFRNREYDFSGTEQYRAVVAAYDRILDSGQVPLILDVGANIGASSIWFARAFPDARVIAVEPDPGNATICRRNTARLPNVCVVEAAIGSQPGTVSLAGKDAWAFQTVRDGDGTIPVRTIQDLVFAAGAQTRLLMVKIDIEGFESDLFADDLHWIEDVAAILIEPHDWLLPGRHTSRSFQRAIAARDFEMLVSGENLIYVAADIMPGTLGIGPARQGVLF